MTRRKEGDHQIRLFPVGEYNADNGGPDETDPLSGLGLDEDPGEFLMKHLARTMVRNGFRFRGSGDSSGDEVG